jgi:RNA recognition motif-containing protein
LYVGNLSFDADKNTLRDAFAEVGAITDVHIVLERERGRSRGFAFVTMASTEIAKEAIARLDGAETAAAVDPEVEAAGRDRLNRVVSSTE